MSRGQCVIRRQIKTHSQCQGHIYENAFPNSESQGLADPVKAKHDLHEDPMRQRACCYYYYGVIVLLVILLNEDDKGFGYRTLGLDRSFLVFDCKTCQHALLEGICSISSEISTVFYAFVPCIATIEMSELEISNSARYVGEVYTRLQREKTKQTTNAAIGSRDKLARDNIDISA